MMCKIKNIICLFWASFIWLFSIFVEKKEKFLPKEINKEDYAQTPESMKIFIRQAFVINHIDHNKKNNNVTNLEWVTQKANTFKALKHYGGNCANATKTKQEEEV